MNRFTLIALAVVFAAAGCKAEFEPTGLTFLPSGIAEDTGDTGDVGGPPQDVVPDVPEGPKSCEDLWRCVLENGCALTPQNSPCLNKCVNTQDDEHMDKFLALKECAAGACATEPNGDAVTQCSFQYCTDKWLKCVSASDGDKTCGDMHRCLIEDCGPDFTSPDCVSNCLREGDKTADQLLSLMTACTNSIFFVAAPLECTGGIAACYAGSNGGPKSCKHALMCEVDCYKQFCPDPDLCTNFSDLVGCMYDCLWGLSGDEIERMYALQQCMVEISHNKLVKDDYNIYSYCALQANECLGQQDQFATCNDAFQCLKGLYNYFPGITVDDPQPFWVVVQDCLADVIHEHRQPLSEALMCLHDHYEGTVIDLVAPWANCKDPCNIP